MGDWENPTFMTPSLLLTVRDIYYAHYGACYTVGGGAGEKKTSELLAVSLSEDHYFING